MHSSIAIQRLAVIAFMIGMLPVSLIADDQNQDEINEKDLLLVKNPLIVKSRVRLINEFSELGDGSQKDKINFALAYGFGIDGENKNFGIGIELPYLFYDPVGIEDASGIGDFKVRAGQMLANDPNGWRAGWFGEIEFDTADESVSAIANQRPQMAFGAGVSHPVFEKFALSTTLQYGWSLEDGETNGSKEEWEYHLTTSYKLIDTVSLALDYKAVLNTVGGSRLFSTLEPSIGWTLGENQNIGLNASLELPIDETNTNWTAKTGITVFF